MKTKYLLTILMWCGVVTQLYAQTKYSLDDCKRMAIEKNRKIENSRLEIKSAAESKKDAFTNYFPSVDAMGFGFKAVDPMVSMNMDETPLNLLEDGMAGAVTLTQPLFAGGKIINGNKLAKLGVEASEQQLRLSENEVLLRTETLFWELISLQEKLTTLDILDRQLTSLRKDTEVSYKAGIITLNDLLQVKLRQNEIKSNRINLENGIFLCKMSLCQNLGIDIGEAGNFEIVAPGIENIVSPASWYVDHRQALYERAELKLLDKNVEAAKLQTRMKRGDYLPTVAVGASYFQQDFMGSWDGNGAAFVSVSIPLSGWWGGSHAIKKQRVNENIAHNDNIDGQEQLLIQMQNVRNELDNAYKQILIAQESIEQATENLRLNNDHYKAGIVNMSDVLDAQTLLQQSRDKFVDAHSAYQKKRFEYLQVTGR